MASVLKKNVDYQANHNDKFLHFVGSNIQSRGFSLRARIVLSAFEDHLLKTKKTVCVHRKLPLSSPSMGKNIFSGLPFILANLIFMYFTHKNIL